VSETQGLQDWNFIRQESELYEHWLKLLVLFTFITLVNVCKKDTLCSCFSHGSIAKISIKF